MNNNHELNDWKQCFSQYRELDSDCQQILRSTAVQQLIDQGFNEVGSSDVSASLFSMWKSGNKNWNESFMNAFYDFCRSNWSQSIHNHLMNYKYNIGDKVKFYDNEYQEDREVTIVGFDDVYRNETDPWYEVQEEGEEVTWYLNEDSIEG